MTLPAIRALVAASLALFAACGSPPEPQSNTPPSAPPTSAATPPSPAASAAAPASPASGLASAEGEAPGLRAELQELIRTDGNTLTLKLAFVNTGQQKVKIDQYGEAGLEMWSLAGLTLVDIVGKKKYFVAKDSDGRCLCSRDISALDPQARVNLWAKFPAPPPDVQKISVMIPHFAPFEGIPIS